MRQLFWNAGADEKPGIFMFSLISKLMRKAIGYFLIICQKISLHEQRQEKKFCLLVFW